MKDAGICILHCHLCTEIHTPVPIYQQLYADPSIILPVIADQGRRTTIGIKHVLYSGTSAERKRDRLPGCCKKYIPEATQQACTRSRRHRRTATEMLAQAICMPQVADLIWGALCSIFLAHMDRRHSNCMHNNRPLQHMRQCSQLSLAAPGCCGSHSFAILMVSFCSLIMT